MQVRLKVIGGKNDNREIRIAVPEFIIGRGDEAHLKPSSDLISRQHCCIRIGDGKVTIEDMGSRNGTFVNGTQITGPIEAKVGDVLRVGRLQFELLIDHAQPSMKRPKVEGVAEAAARTAGSSAGQGGDIEDSISSWLTEEVNGERLQDTRQLSLEDTKAILAEAERKALEKERERKVSDSGQLTTDSREADSKEKRGPGKLPPRPKLSHESAKGAADDVLREGFNRR
ncbi:MAG: FHA domain-containing protein [Planctomycetota bacterium]